MGYSDSNFQLGQMLHNEYETTYAANEFNRNQQSDLLPPVRFLSSLGTVIMAILFIVQVFGV